MFDFLKRKPEAAPRRVEPRMRRNFASAATGRLTADWPVTGVMLDESIRRDLRALRTRSRKLAMDSDYMKGFLRTIERNIIGADGVGVRWRVKRADGSIDPLNEEVRAAFKDWCEVGVATVCGMHSFRDVEGLAARVMGRDGEFIIREIRGFQNGFGYALQVLPADLLDETYNDTLRNGNTVRMGVERDKWLRPVAYHFRQTPKDPILIAYLPGGDRVRVPADEIIHLFLADDVWQTRGVPWAHTAARRLNMLGNFEDAALVNARVGAAKMGFYQARDELVGDFDGEESPDKDDEFIEDAEPGKFGIIPHGYEFKEFNPAFPTGDLAPFVKGMLRGAATGLGVDYNAWANDKEGVNYSTQRSGMVDERDQWKVLQTFVISRVHCRIVRGWLEQAVLSRKINMPFSRVSEFRRPQFHPRGWTWIDPQKEIRGYAEEIALGINSRLRVAASLGRDLREVTEELAAEQAMAEEMGVPYRAPVPAKEEPTDKPKEEQDDA